jgi:hypothetical protein
MMKALKWLLGVHGLADYGRCVLTSIHPNVPRLGPPTPSPVQANHTTGATIWNLSPVATGSTGLGTRPFQTMVRRSQSKWPWQGEHFVKELRWQMA